MTEMEEYQIEIKETKDQEKFPEEVLIIPIMNSPIFPGMIAPIILSEDKYIAALDQQIHKVGYVALNLVKHKEVIDESGQGFTFDEDDMEEDELEDLGVVCAPLFPKSKRESWWIVIGDTSSNKLLSLKRISLKKSQKVKLEFMAPDEAGDYDLTLFCMSDSYLGCDQEYSVPLSVAIADSDDDSE